MTWQSRKTSTLSLKSCTMYIPTDLDQHIHSVPCCKVCSDSCACKYPIWPKIYVDHLIPHKHFYLDFIFMNASLYSSTRSIVLPKLSIHLMAVTCIYLSLISRQGAHAVFSLLKYNWDCQHIPLHLWSHNYLLCSLHRLGWWTLVFCNLCCICPAASYIMEPTSSDSLE